MFATSPWTKASKKESRGVGSALTRILALAREALARGGNMPCILNAANEVVNRAFLEDRVSFLGMSDVIAETMQRVPFITKPTYEDYVATDRLARITAEEILTNRLSPHPTDCRG